MKIFLETPRLILRQFTLDDVDNLVKLDSDPDVMHFINGGIPSSDEFIANQFLPDILNYYNQYKTLGFWAISEKSSNEFIGWILLRPESRFKLANLLKVAESDAVELGYRLRKISWGKGYATEASQALITKSFTEWNITKIIAWALAENKASVRVMEKVGLKLQQEYIITADLLPNASLLKNPLIKNLLNRQLVKYQLVVNT